MIFRLQHVAIGTRDLPGTSGELVLKLGEYVETAIEYNNDILVGKVLPPGSRLITRIKDSENGVYLLQNHLGTLGREKAEILLFDKASLPGRLGEYAPLGNHFGVTGEGLTPDDLEEYRKVLGEYPEYISIPLNPWYYQKSLLEKARELGIKVISHEILGGPLAARLMIKTYSLQFLARLAAYHSDIVVMSSTGNLEEEMILAKTLEDLRIGRDLSDNTNYELSKEVRKSPLGATRQVHTYSAVGISGKDHIFKNDFDGYIGPTELILSQSGALEEIPTMDPGDLKASDNIYTETALIMATISNTQAPTRKEEVKPFYRYVVLGILREYYPSPRYKTELSQVGDVLRITIRDRLMPWRKSLEYVLYISERLDYGYNVFFRNL